MGKALADAFARARSVQEVDDALSQKLSRMMWEGPEGDLTLTENAQPAIMAPSLAMMRGAGKGDGPGRRQTCLSGGRSLPGRIFRALRRGRFQPWPIRRGF